MPGLRGFLEDLERRGELLRVEEELSPRFEIPAVLRALDGGPAVLFERVEGFDSKVVGGVCATRGRICRALGIEPGAFYQRLLHAVEHPTPVEVVEDGPVKEVVEEASLDRLPVLTHFKGDPGPYITSGILYARSPDGSVENVSFHRILILDDKRATLRIVPRHLYRLCQEARGEVEALDVSVSLGLHPALMVAAASPAPFGVNEFEVANTLMGGGLRLVECEHVDALAPADAELVLEGRLLLDEEAPEGPFVDLTGTYDIQRPQPVVEFVGVMHRRDYLYQALLPSGSEHRLLMGMPREARIWEYVRNIVPTVRGVNLTMGGCGWLHCVVSFKKFREGDPKNVLMAVFAAHPSLKHAVVVDEDIDPFDMEMVEWAIATRFRGDEDLLIIPHVRVSSLDPASDQERELGCKVGIDATRPLSKPEEDFRRAEIPVSGRVRRLLEGLKRLGE
ncbi:UbiD family decarboxylase [Candidatus Bathyarchaeota archaeon]|nr:MAG: UbiD family decarboxylase [Candidatus Bathyarchaeota archaeon]